MNRSGNTFKLLTWLMGLLLTAFVAGCGGGGGGGGATTIVEGQGNFGAPIIGGAVQMVCASSTPGTVVTTSATGGFTVAAPGSVPCVIKISGGNLVGGPFYSIFEPGQARANVNQLTTMLAFQLADGNPETFFTSPGTISTKITAAAVAADKETIRTSVIANLAGAVTPAISTSFDFLQTAFTSDSTGFDQMLDKLGFASTGNTAASITFNGAPLLALDPSTNVASTTTSTPISSATLAAAGNSGTGGSSTQATAPNLGEAGRFVILASQAVTTTGVTAISNGDIGIMDIPRTGIAGFTPGVIAGSFDELTNGLSYAPDDANPAPFAAPLKFATLPVGDPWPTTLAMINQARTDLGTANNFLGATNATAPDQVLPIQLGNLTLAPGVYRVGTNVQITTGALQLDALGDTNAVWIFDIGGTLTTGAPGGNITFVGGVGQAKNVFWRTGGVTVIGESTSFIGNVFAGSQVNLLNGATVTGRLFGITDRVTLIGNTVTKAP